MYFAIDRVIANKQIYNIINYEFVEMKILCRNDIKNSIICILSWLIDWLPSYFEDLNLDKFK